jgi:dTDP-4-dehydrorhamnose reductase
MKLLITGASGLYGSKLAELALKKQHEVFSVHSQHDTSLGVPIHLDITDKEKVAAEVEKVKPDVIVHAASMTDVDKCEQDRDLAWKVNVEGTRNVVEAARAQNAYLLYISTDYVFDGEKGCYKETDQPSPLSFYAYTKLKAEENVKDSVRDFCIARPSVIYGATPAAGKVNFALWLLTKLREKELVKVVVDQWVCPTLNSSLAEMTLEVVERRLTGFYHMSGRSRVSRYEFAAQVAQTFGLDESLLVSSRMKDFSFAAKRPRDSSLDTSKAWKELKNKPLNLSEALERLKVELNQTN